MLNKNILPLFFALVLFAFFPIIFSNCLLGDDIETLRSKVEITVPGKNIEEKLKWVKSNKQSGGNYLIEVTADETISPTGLDYGKKPNVTVIFRGIGANRTVSLSSNGEIYIHKGVTLVLDNNITLLGRSNNDGWPLVKAGTGGTLIMKSGATITGNTSDFVGGVIADGTFIMNGGTISGNNGRGVFVGIGGIFTMSSGTISGNTRGGVYVEMAGTRDDTYYKSGTFTMTGGTIYDGVYVQGSYTYEGTYYAGGTFTMTGGTIYDGVSVGSGGTFTRTGGTIYD